MKRILLLTLSCLLLGFLLMGAKCEILSFDAQSLPVSVKITEEFHIQGSTANQSDSGIINMAEILTDNGIDYTKIDSITIQDIAITFKDNNGPNAIQFASAYAKFKPASGSTYYELVSLSNYSNLFTNIVDIPFDPLSDQAAYLLGTIPANIAYLSTYISQAPPKTFEIVAGLNGIAAASLPADFKIDLAITIQVHYTP